MLPYLSYGGSRGPDAGTSGSALFSSDGPIGERRVRDFVSVVGDISAGVVKSTVSYNTIQRIVCATIKPEPIELT